MRLKYLVFSLVGLFLLLAGGFFAAQIYLPLKPVLQKTIIIAPGTPTQKIARRLEQNGIIRSAWAFRLLARLRGEVLDLQRGEYRFADAAPMTVILERLRSGDVVLHRVTVPEGLRSDEILALLAKRTATPLNKWQKAYQHLLAGRDGEGLLLPETYTYRKPVNEGQILLDMLRAQINVIKKLPSDAFDARDLRIVASIIEKETAVKAERPMVAAVIRNRLRRGMALQMDPTVIYGLWHEDKAFSGNIHKRDLKRDTAWNTYTRKGLPATPICNPGAASLRAAAHPADVDYLYFVADGSGGHAFAASLEEHNRNVQRWMKIERQR